MKLIGIILLGSSLYLSAQEFGSYKISKGDSFSSISQKVRIPINTLMKVNPDITPTRMKIGQVVRYPLKPEGAKQNEKLRASESLVNYIRGFETFSPTNYNDVGKLAIGFGHRLLPGESFIEPITEMQALSILRKDISKFEEAVKLSVNVPLNQNQFDALVSLTYNIGPGAIENSPVTKALNKTNYQEAANQFIFHNKSKGIVLNGLISRRNIEKQLFLK